MVQTTAVKRKNSNGMSSSASSLKRSRRWAPVKTLSPPEIPQTSSAPRLELPSNHLAGTLAWLSSAGSAAPAREECRPVHCSKCSLVEWLNICQQHRREPSLSHYLDGPGNVEEPSFSSYLPADDSSTADSVASA